MGGEVLEAKLTHSMLMSAPGRSSRSSSRSMLPSHTASYTPWREEKSEMTSWVKEGVVHGHTIVGEGRID